MTPRRRLKPGGYSYITHVFALMGLAGLFSGCATRSNSPDISYANQRRIQPNDAQEGDRPPTARTLYAMARILGAQGRDEECAFVLSRIIRQHRSFMPAYCDLGELHLRHRRFGDAITTLSAGLDVSPHDPVLLNNLGMCRLLQADYEEALDTFTRAAGIMPQDTRFRANMAVALGMMGRYHEALALYRQLIPEVDARHNLNVLCEARNDTERAFELLLLAVSTHEPHSDASASSPENVP